jgi:hypothetical protein
MRRGDGETRRRGDKEPGSRASGGCESLDQRRNSMRTLRWSIGGVCLLLLLSMTTTAARRAGDVNPPINAAESFASSIGRVAGAGRSAAQEAPDERRAEYEANQPTPPSSSRDHRGFAPDVAPTPATRTTLALAGKPPVAPDMGKPLLSFSEHSQLDPPSVRQSAESILSSPEFRGFRRLDARDGRSFPDGKGSFPGTAPRDGSGRGKGDEEEPEASSQERSSDRRATESPQARQLLGGAASNAVGFVFSMLAWAIVAVICGFIVYLVVKAILSYERPHRAESGDTLRAADEEVEEQAPAPGELPADVYVTQAKRLAREGRYREAIAQLLLGAMSHIERAGLVKYRQGLTHRDYLRAARDRESFYRAMRGMVRVYEPIGFGRRNATQDHFQATLTDYESGFRPTTASRGESGGVGSRSERL